MHEKLAADPVAVRISEYAPRELGAARAHETGEPDDLALAHVEGDILKNAAPGFQVEGVPPLDPQDHLVGHGMGPRGVHVVDFPSHHVLDEHRLAHLALVRVQGADGLAVAEDRHRVGDLDHFLQLVRDENAGDTVALELPEDRKEVFAVVLVQGRGGLVEDEQLHVAAHGLGDLDELLLADAEILHQGIGAHVETDLAEHLGGLLDRLVPVHRDPAPDLVAEEDVLVDGHFGNERELLVDDGDADLFTVGDAVEDLGLPLVDDVPRVLPVGVDAAQDLHEG